MTRTHGTPLHTRHSIMTCNCPACDQHKNADTLIIARSQQATPDNQLVAFEQVISIDSETGERTVYLWPLYRCDVNNMRHARQKMHTFESATTVFG